MTNVYDTLYANIAAKLAERQQELFALLLVSLTLKVKGKPSSSKIVAARALIEAARHELRTLKRAVVIEEYLDQIEALLERMD